jgi:CRP-like cAMP-binding protein
MVMECILRTFKRRDYLPRSQNKLWRIKSGAVRALAFTADGKVVPLGLWGSNDVVGHPLIGVQGCRIECLADVKVEPLDLDGVDVVYQAALGHISQLQHLLLLRDGQIYDRLLHCLRWLGQKFGHDTKRGTWIDLQLTHQDLADLIGTTRVTVTRLLQQFESDGLIYRSAKNKVLLCRQAGEQWQVL